MLRRVLSLEEIFPPFALRIACGPVELRVLRDDDLPELVATVQGGIEVPGLPMPFLRDWHAVDYSRGAPHDWRLALVVHRGGELVGTQDVGATDFAQTGAGTTGSWMGRAASISVRRRSPGTMGG